MNYLLFTTSSRLSFAAESSSKGPEINNSGIIRRVYQAT